MNIQDLLGNFFIIFIIISTTLVLIIGLVIFSLAVYWLLIKKEEEGGKKSKKKEIRVEPFELEGVASNADSLYEVGCQLALQDVKIVLENKFTGELDEKVEFHDFRKDLVKEREDLGPRRRGKHHKRSKSQVLVYFSLTKGPKNTLR